MNDPSAARRTPPPNPQNPPNPHSPDPEAVQAPAWIVYDPPPGDPEVLHADADLVVVNKPAGLLAVPGIGDDKQDCVRARVHAMFPHATGPMTCHRLDLSTSGVMVLALNPQTHRNLSIQFEHRRTVKRYLALVEGHLAADAGEINTPMRKDTDRRPAMLIDYHEGKPSVTRWRVLAREQWGPDALSDRIPVTRVELEPHTGRTHQLRVHAAHPRITTLGTPGPEHTPGLNAPILGDDLYAGLPAPRLMLHAAMLTIHHPTDGRQMSFRAPDPF